LKEKSLAAVRAGIKTIIIPERNEKDLDEIPKSLRRKLQWVKVKTMSDVLKIALLDRDTRNVRSGERRTLKLPFGAKRPLQKQQRERTVPLRP
jgi:predicted ATP-dependent protease